MRPAGGPEVTLRIDYIHCTSSFTLGNYLNHFSIWRMFLVFTPHIYVEVVEIRGQYSEKNYNKQGEYPSQKLGPIQEATEFSDGQRIFNKQKSR